MSPSYSTVLRQRSPQPAQTIQEQVSEIHQQLDDLRLENQLLKSKLQEIEQNFFQIEINSESCLIERCSEQEQRFEEVHNRMNRDYNDIMDTVEKLETRIHESHRERGTRTEYLVRCMDHLIRGNKSQVNRLMRLMKPDRLDTIEESDSYS